MKAILAIFGLLFESCHGDALHVPALEEVNKQNRCPMVHLPLDAGQGNALDELLLSDEEYQN